MNKIKKILKSVIGKIKSFSAGISERGKNVYIGRDVRIIGGVNITLKNNVSIRPHTDLWCKTGNIVIENGSDIGERSRISIINSLYIGKKVLISPNVYISDCDHKYDNIELPVIDQGTVKNDNTISIGDGSYIGINSVILGNVKIGKHCIIGANSVVTKDIPDYSVAAGTPAKVIKKYNFESKLWELQ